MCRGRNADCSASPAQIRMGATNTYGHLPRINNVNMLSLINVHHPVSVMLISSR